MWQMHVTNELKSNQLNITLTMLYKCGLLLMCFRSWSPLARDNPFNDLHYVRGGFVYLQDMVDRGITTVQTGVRQPLGVYAQQMPYPCYTDDA